MALLKEESYTIEDIYALPDGERAELIDGHIYYMAPPSYKHQKLVMELSAIIRNYIKQHKGTCEVLPAPFAVYLDEINNTYVEPDISVICDPNKLDDKGCKGAPDWIIEIVSPASRKMDYLLKLFKYRSAGVREYWIVDIAKNRITVYNFNHDYSIEEYSFTDTSKSWNLRRFIYCISQEINILVKSEKVGNTSLLYGILPTFYCACSMAYPIV